MMIKSDYSNTVYIKIVKMPESEKLHLLHSRETKRYLTRGVSAVSDSSNSGMHKYQAPGFPGNYILYCCG
jgi:hypothetical protein